MPRKKKATPEQIDQARDIHQSNDVEINDDAGVSEADNGFWVQAWVWVPTGEEDET